MTGAREFALGAGLDAADPAGSPALTDPMSRCATEAAAQVRDVILALAWEAGRSGVIIGLRLRAQDLAQSGLADDQVRCCAFNEAADDLAWGRKPLEGWLQAMCNPPAVSGDERAAVRATLPEEEGADINGAAQVLASVIVDRCYPDHGARVSGGEGPLEAARALQTCAFDALTRRLRYAL